MSYQLWNWVQDYYSDVYNEWLVDACEFFDLEDFLFKYYPEVLEEWDALCRQAEREGWPIGQLYQQEDNNNDETM